MPDKILHVVSVSGGKDSSATLLLAFNTHPRENIRAVFADTGNEHSLVYEYLDYLESFFDIKIKRLKSDFSRQIANKRKFIEEDCRTNGNCWIEERKKSALAVLYPTGNPYLDLCLWKGRFPSRKAQFCTQYLKTEPLIRYQHELVDEGYTVVSWQGVRRDESKARENVLAIEFAGDDIWQYRPIADWTAEMVFDYCGLYDLEPNPLYKLGMTRVGCMPCINARKSEIREIAARFPEQVRRIREWEELVSQAGKRGAASFFPNLDRDPIDKPTIHHVVVWANTLRGGTEHDPESMTVPQACSSSYGLCE